MTGGGGGERREEGEGGRERGGISFVFPYLFFSSFLLLILIAGRDIPENN